MHLSGDLANPHSAFLIGNRNPLRGWRAAKRRGRGESGEGGVGAPAGLMPTGSPRNRTEVPEGPAPAAPGFRLVGSDHGHRAYTLPPRSVLTVGRDAANDIVIADATVSGRHAELRWEGRCWVVCDVGSSNGTYVSYGGAPGGDRQIRRWRNHRLRLDS